MRTITRRLRSLPAGIIVCTFAGFLIGCGADKVVATSTPPPNPPVSTGVSFSGKALAGSQPLAGASVQLYAAGTSGNGSMGKALLTSELTTDTAGGFTVPTSYTCPATGSQLYIVVRGGHIGGSSSNTSITLATAIGACSGITSSSQYVVNEVTTAAMVWGLSQFLSGGANLGASATNAQGLTNAVATVAHLANFTTGSSPGAGFPANGVSPAGKINTLANLLNTCTASTASTACSQLFAATTVNGASAPANTFDATLNLVRHPGANVAALYMQAAASSAFTPVLAAAPFDWTLFVAYTGGGMNYPTTLGVDSVGDIWVASYFSVLSEFTAAGSPIFANGITSGGLLESYGLAIDAQDHVWVTNEESPSTVNKGLGSVSVFNAGGQPISGANGYSAGGIYVPTSVAVDTNANVWVVDYQNAHVTLLSSSGAPLLGASGYTTDSLNFPVTVAVDANHNAWVGDQTGANVTRVSSDGSQFLKIACCDEPTGLAIDASGNVWVANYGNDSISELSNSGSVLLSGITGGGIKHPQGIAVDGAGTIWVANFRGPSLSQLAGAASATPGQVLSPAAGWGPEAGLLEAYALAIDASGNLWVSNFGSNSITEFIGMAAPVKTPMIGPVQTP